MKRFCGLMPSDEIEKTVIYKYLPNDSLIEIEAGPNGWTIIAPDESTKFKDEKIGTEKNFENAENELYSEYEAKDLFRMPHHINTVEEAICEKDDENAEAADKQEIIDQLTEICADDNERKDSWNKNHNKVNMNEFQAKAFAKFDCITPDNELDISKLIRNPEIMDKVRQWLDENKKNNSK